MVECVITEMWTNKVKITLVNVFNPCVTLEETKFREIMDEISGSTGQVIWAGDLNAHNELWGSRTTDRNGRVVEDFIERYNLTVLNGG